MDYLLAICAKLRSRCLSKIVVAATSLLCATIAPTLVAAEQRQIAIYSTVDVGDLHPDVTAVAVQCTVNFPGGKQQAGAEQRPVSTATHGFIGPVTTRVRYDTVTDGTPTNWRCALKLVVGGSLLDPVLNGSDPRTQATGTLEAIRTGAVPPL